PAAHAHALDVQRSQIEQPFRIAHGLPSLDGHEPLDAVLRHERPQVVEEEVALQHVHAVADPGVLARIVAPEMMVGIEHAPYRMRGAGSWRLAVVDMRAGTR